MTEKAKPEPLTITIKEAAARLGLSADRAYEAVKLGQIPTIPMGKRRVVPVAALNRLMNGEAA
jgi:excisionase family DNA binding protein